MAATPPALGSVENRHISASPAPGGALCLKVEESGLPPGKETGSFLARIGVFRVAGNGSALRVKTCAPGTTTID